MKNVNEMKKLREEAAEIRKKIEMDRKLEINKVSFSFILFHFFFFFFLSLPFPHHPPIFDIIKSLIL